jgi:hypothetical protein
LVFLPLISGKKSKLAKYHLNQVKELLSSIDGHLSDLANDAKPANLSPQKEQNTPSKRKAGEILDGVIHVPKKKNVKKHDRNNSLTLSQREDRAMKELIQHILSCGGKVYVCLPYCK